jgi:hypothetical protein
MMKWVERWFRAAKKPSVTWTPCIVLTDEERAEWDKRLAGRALYYVDEKGWPIPPARTGSENPHG